MCARYGNGTSVRIDEASPSMRTGGVQIGAHAAGLQMRARLAGATGATDVRAAKRKCGRVRRRIEGSTNGIVVLAP